MVKWGTIWQPWMLLPRLWKWRTTPDCEMLSSPDTLRLVLIEFSSLAWCVASGFPILGLPFLPDRWKSCNSSKISWTIWLTHFDQQCLSPNECFGCFHGVWLSSNPQSIFSRIRLHLHVHLCGEKKCTTYQRTNYHNITNHCRYLVRLKPLWSRDIRATNLHVPKYGKTFDPPPHLEIKDVIDAF